MMTREQHSALVDLVTNRHAQDPALQDMLEQLEEYYDAANDVEDDVVGNDDLEARYNDFLIYLNGG